MWKQGSGAAKAEDGTLIPFVFNLNWVGVPGRPVYVDQLRGPVKTTASGEYAEGQIEVEASEPLHRSMPVYLIDFPMAGDMDEWRFMQIDDASGKSSSVYSVQLVREFARV